MGNLSMNSLIVFAILIAYVANTADGLFLGTGLATVGAPIVTILSILGFIPKVIVSVIKLILFPGYTALLIIKALLYIPWMILSYIPRLVIFLIGTPLRYLLGTFLPSSLLGLFFPGHSYVSSSTSIEYPANNGHPDVVIPGW